MVHTTEPNQEGGVSLNIDLPSFELLKGEEFVLLKNMLVTDNTMYVAKSDEPNVADYFIDIAGTNAVSPFG